MKPLIGITTELQPDTLEGQGTFSNTLLTGYSEALALAGCLPVALPLARPDTVRETLSRLDGLILSGGMDIPVEVLGEAPHPSLEPMQPERWPSECLWLETALEMGKPVLGICLGMQVMAVTAGARMILDIATQRPGSISHTEWPQRLRHEVIVEEGTRLASFAPALRVETTSSHHQAIVDVPKGYRLAATAPDGVIEAIEMPDRPFVIGVQWHAERTPTPPDWVLVGFARACEGT
ncbi:MAG: gamma-glutamyl-gamma-aminobutyrate hydrolase family protein [FCB group bacterium]|jgi:putative glutamine amidotransferase|nr:gamma-glutamyl-gamma-aminobutyrate hydrolase family protein [FCB group bacterium]